jgi:mycoredoxin
VNFNIHHSSPPNPGYNIHIINSSVEKIVCITENPKVRPTSLIDSIIIVYGTGWCGDCLRARRILERRKIPFEWIDIDHDPQAEQYVLNHNHGFRSVPTILFPDGSVLVEPSFSQLVHKLQV